MLDQKHQSDYSPFCNPSLLMYIMDTERTDHCTGHNSHDLPDSHPFGCLPE